MIPPPAREVTGQWKEGGGGATATTKGRLEGADAKPDNVMLLNTLFEAGKVAGQQSKTTLQLFGFHLSNFKHR